MHKPSLHDIGRALFGDLWQSALADALKINSRTVRRWAAGDYPPPDGVWFDIAVLCRERGEALSEIAGKIEKALVR